MKRWLAAIAFLLLLIAGVAWRAGRPAATHSVEPRPAVSPHAHAARSESPLRLPPPTVEVEADHESVEGRVVDARSGAAVKGALIAFLHDGVAVSASGGSDGRFRLILPGPGRYLLESLSAPGYLPYSSAPGEIVLAARPGIRIRDLELYLEPRIECLARVLDPQGKAAVGARVTVEEERLTADARGEARFACRPDVMVEAWLPGVGHGRAQLNRAAELSRTLTVRLQPGDPPPRASIAGRVEEFQGPPIGAGRGAAASLPIDGAVVTAGAARTTTDHLGRFSLDLDAGAWDVTASAPGLIATTAYKVKTGTADLVLSLPPGGKLRGVVRDGNGRPATAFTVVLWHSW